MCSNLRTGRKLLVISDTTLLTKPNDKRGYEPVVRELDVIADLFDEIIWLGCQNTQLKVPLSQPQSPNIHLIAMPISGGKSLLSKLKIAFLYPVYLFYILKYLPKVTHVHTRAPSHPTLLALLISKWDKTRIYWHKYAGNWIEPNPPKSYALQRSVLKGISNPKVFGTVNGKWTGEKKHILSFENPCIYEDERILAGEISQQKDFNKKLTIVFVGALSRFKGVIELINCIDLLTCPQRFSELIIVGNGELWEEVNKLSSKMNKVPIRVTGALSRADLAEIYAGGHILALPSLSEGFPKVIGEGAAYGCIPLVTNISSINQYIQQGINGFLLKDNYSVTIAAALNEISKENNLKQISINATSLSSIFTYENYRLRIVNEIL